MIATSANRKTTDCWNQDSLPFSSFAILYIRMQGLGKKWADDTKMAPCLKGISPYFYHQATRRQAL